MTEPEQPARHGSTRGLALRGALGVAALAAGVTIAVVLKETKPQPKLAPTTERSLTVRVVPATLEPVARVWLGYGTARAMKEATVAAEVAGRVVERPARIQAGVWLDRGDLIARLDASAYEDQLAAAQESITGLEAQLEQLDVEGASLKESADLAAEGVALAEREVARARKALAQGAATENEIDRLLRDLTRQRRELSDLRQRRDSIPTRRQEAQAQIRSQRATARLAQRDLDHARITAPIAGVLRDVWADEGDWVGVGQRVARIVDLSRVETPLRLPVSAAGAVRAGDTIALEADGPTERRWTGRIVRIAPVADEQTRTVTVYTVLEQDGRTVTPDTLLPGQFLIGRARSTRVEPRLLVPRIAITGDRVAVVGAGGLVQTRRVRVAFHLDGAYPHIDPTIREWAVLDEGLEPGALVIVSNLDEIEEGLPVRVAGGAVSATAAATRENTGAAPSAEPGAETGSARQ